MLSKLPRIALFAVVMSTAGAASQSCRPASYEILKPGKHKKNDAKTPDHLIPPSNGNLPPNQPSPSTEPGPAPQLPDASNPGPTARVEVIFNDQSVTRVRVDQPTLIRPTFDTVDPDDVGVSACVNPGIVRADYDIGGEADKSAARVAGCEPLSVPYTFTRTGDYAIVMEVTSNEGEKAIAKMTLTVIDANAPLTSDGGFTIAADPMIAQIDQLVTFTGRCDLKNLPLTITWEFGDGGKASGQTVKHGYAASGSKEVNAMCTDATGKSLDAEVTIVVIKSDKPIVVPGTPTPKPNPDPIPTPTPTPNPIPQPTPNPGEPGQNPGQKPDQKPGQNPTPPTEPILPEDPFCPCYDPGSGGWYQDPSYVIPY